MSRFRLAPLARRDLDALWDYIGIEKDSPAAAFRLVETLYEKFELLAANPLMGQYREDLADLIKDIRSFSVGNYVIYYQPAPNGVRIGRVIHGARDVRTVLQDQ